MSAIIEKATSVLAVVAAVFWWAEPLLAQQVACDSLYAQCISAGGNHASCCDDALDRCGDGVGFFGNGCSELVAPDPANTNLNSASFLGDGSYTYSFEVRNDDQCDCAEPFTVRITLSDLNDCDARNDCDDHVVDLTISGLDKNDSTILSDTIVLPETDPCRDKYCRLIVTIDPDDEIPEEDEGNNAADFRLDRLPDLTALDYACSVNNNDSWFHEFDVRNNDPCANARIGDLGVQYEVKSFDGCTETGVTNRDLATGDICPGVVRGVTVSYIGDSGCACCRVVVDDSTRMDESDEHNNIAYSQKPDLEMISVTCSYDEAAQEYEVRYDVRHTSPCGEGDLTDTVVAAKVFNCPDDSFAMRYDTPFTTHGDVTITQSTHLSAPAGCTCCRVWVDYMDEDVDESDEQNNTLNFNRIQDDQGGRRTSAASIILVGAISNMRNDVSQTYTSAISNAPAGWNVSISPTMVTVPRLSVANITLTVDAPIGASGSVLVISTEVTAGETQTNEFLIGSPVEIPAVSNWSLAVMTLLMLTAGIVVAVKRKVRSPSAP